MKTLVLFALGFAVLAQESRRIDAVDPGGWSKAKWGMTVEEVVQVFNGQAKRTDGCKERSGSPPSAKDPKVCLAEIEDIEIEGDHFRVAFRFDRVTKRLDIVNLEPVGDLYAWDTRAEKLERMLTEKYGQPAYRKNTDQRLFKGVDCTWVFPQTKIFLMGAYSPSRLIKGGPLLTVIYSRRDQESEKL